MKTIRSSSSLVTFWNGIAFLLAALLSTSLFAEKTARIFVDSLASEEYMARKENGEGAKRETYFLLEGNFYGGTISDKSLNNVTFNDIKTALGEDMKARNYYPATTPDDCDLLIIVHYGSTAVPEDLSELFDFEGDEGYEDDDISIAPSGPDYTYYNDLRQMSEANGAHPQDMDNRALGFDRALNRRYMSQSEELELRMELEDERYFIILMAWDYKKLTVEKEKQLLWTTRFSLPSVGTNFVAAYPALTRAATAYYGTSLEKYAKSRTHFGTGSVDIGDLETVEVVDEKKEAPAPEKK